jgi:hypothetical protein
MWWTYNDFLHVFSKATHLLFAIHYQCLYDIRPDMLSKYSSQKSFAKKAQTAVNFFEDKLINIHGLTLALHIFQASLLLSFFGIKYKKIKILPERDFQSIINAMNPYPFFLQLKNTYPLVIPDHCMHNVHIIESITNFINTIPVYYCYALLHSAQMEKSYSKPNLIL